MTKLEEAKNINDAIDFKRDVAKHIMSRNSKSYEEASKDAAKILNLDDTKKFSTFDITLFTSKKQENSIKPVVEEEKIEESLEKEDVKVKVLTLNNDRRVA